MAESAYEGQHRGDAADYARYLAGMDASMRQKIAMTAAFLLCRGRVADMGMGSGAGSAALASLYPGLQVVGVDIDPEMVARARDVHRLPNLEFGAGDVAAPVFPERSLDGIFDSSVLHHVTSYGGYLARKAEEALAVQARALREGGVLVVRDFVSPGRELCELEVPHDDGDASDDPRSCSSASLLTRFAREARGMSEQRGFPMEEGTDDACRARGRRRFRLSLQHAAEFVLRKDYRSDWDSEIKEEYTYFTQEEFEACFARLGLRVLASTPVRNPWIVRHRLQGKVGFFDPSGKPLELPPTNYVIAGERVPASEGVTVREVESGSPQGYLELSCHRDGRSGHVRDLVRRPHVTVDVIPWFLGDGASGAREGELFVLARTSYPRPILAAANVAPPLDGARPCPYVAEPLIVEQTDRPIGLTVEDALERIARVAPAKIRSLRPGHDYFPSPGGILEQVRSVLVEIPPTLLEERLDNRSGFSTGGRIAAIAAEQILRAAQVGALPDARLETNVYALQKRLGRGPGPWIGAEISPGKVAAPPAPSDLGALLRRPPRRVFTPVSREDSPRFLELRSAAFEERAADGSVVARAGRDLVVPRTLSTNTIAAALLLRSNDRVLLGVDDDDLPAAQCFLGSSALLVTPAWRLPKTVERLSAATTWVRERLRLEHGLETGEVWELGGRYYPSAGLTPEVVYPLAFEIRDVTGLGRQLSWVPLEEIVAGIDRLMDGHLRIVALRAAHALGLLGRE